MASPHDVLVAQVLVWLVDDGGLDAARLRSDPSERRRLIDRILTVRPARPIPSHAQAQLDALWAMERESQRPVDADQLLAASAATTVVGKTRAHLWRGDITTLGIDAIVNAANEELLGCFRPDHACIDNAIHRVAGPRLRQDCARIVEAQGHREPTGSAKLTPGYYLPARFVLHTVGPIVPDHRPTLAQRGQLAQCYETCLDLAAEAGLRSIAFCAISTGVFGYPKPEAAEVAMATVMPWLVDHPGTLDTVVFDVFTEEDERIYRTLTWWPS